MPTLYSGHQLLLLVQVWADGYGNDCVGGALPHLKSELL